MTRLDAYKLLHQGTIALSQMEHNGIRVNEDLLNSKIKELVEDIRVIESELRETKTYLLWRKRFGHHANLGSLEQLGTVLFDSMGLPYEFGTTATGRYRVDDEVLRSIDHPFVKEYMRYGDLKSLKQRMVGLVKETVDGLIHPSINLHTVKTYRSSESEPNLQNIPHRSPWMAEAIRRCFRPRKGRRFVEVDFSVAEARVGCSYHFDKNMMAYFADKTKDMHCDYAMLIFGLTKEQVNKETTRDWTKNRFIYPQFYGSVYFQCAPSIWEAVTSETRKIPGTDLTVKEHLAAQGIGQLGTCSPKLKPRPNTFEYRVKEAEDDLWYKRFTEYTQWKKDWWSMYQRQGYYDLLTGFRIEGVYKRNKVLNGAIQGTTFHCLLKAAIIKVQQILNKYKMKTLLVNEIHDSTVADCPENELQNYLEIAGKAVKWLQKIWPWLIVPLEVEAKVSKVDGDWFELEKVQI